MNCTDVTNVCTVLDGEGTTAESHGKIVIFLCLESTIALDGEVTAFDFDKSIRISRFIPNIHLIADSLAVHVKNNSRTLGNYKLCIDNDVFGNSILSAYCKCLGEGFLASNLANVSDFLLEFFRKGGDVHCSIDVDDEFIDLAGFGTCTFSIGSLNHESSGEDSEFLHLGVLLHHKGCVGGGNYCLVYERSADEFEVSSGNSGGELGEVFGLERELRGLRSIS